MFNCMDGGCGVASHQPPVRPWTQAERDADITRLHSLGFTDKQIGERVEQTASTITKRRKELGLTGWDRRSGALKR